MYMLLKVINMNYIQLLPCYGYSLVERGLAGNCDSKAPFGLGHGVKAESLFLQRSYFGSILIELGA